MLTDDVAARARCCATQARALARVRAIDFGALLLDRLRPCCARPAGRGRGRPVRIDQWVPALHRGDAIGDSARLMRDAFRRWGHEADVYALELDDDLRGRRPCLVGVAAGRRATDVVILHYALPSPLTAALRGAPRPARPPPPQHHAARVLRGLRRRRWRASARIGRRGAGQRCATHVRPRPRRQRVQPAGAGGGRLRAHGRAADLPRLRALPRAAGPGAARAILGDGRTNLLFVGRLAPNKRHDDLIRLAAYWKRFISPDVRLVLVGKLPRRARLLRRPAGADVRARASRRAEVVFTGHVEPPRPARLLRDRARLRLHERARGVRGAAGGGDADGRAGAGLRARPRCRDTLGGAGVQFDEKALDEVAEMAHRLATDRDPARRPCSRASAAGSPPSRPPRWRRRCKAVRGRAVSDEPRVPRSPSSSSATARRSRAARSRWRARWPSACAADYRVTVFTTCARDYVTWRNELPAGSRSVNGVEVRRFPVRGGARPRRLQPLLGPLYGRPRTPRGGARVAAPAGARGAARSSRPCPRTRDRFHAVVFFTYLYYPTYWGLARPPPRVACWCRPPTTSRRCASRIYDEVFARPRAFALPDPGRRRRWCARASTSAAGRRRWRASGIDMPAPPDAAAFRAGTVVDRALRAVRRAHRRRQGLRGDDRALRRVPRAGRHARTWCSSARWPWTCRRCPGVRYLGYLSEDEKHAALAGASVVVVPEPVREPVHRAAGGFAVGTPGLVNARSAVLKDHCLRVERAASSTATRDEFAEALRPARAATRACAARMGESGRRYVEAQLPLGGRARPLPRADRGRRRARGLFRVVAFLAVVVALVVRGGT